MRPTIATDGEDWNEAKAFVDARLPWFLQLCGWKFGRKAGELMGAAYEAAIRLARSFRSELPPSAERDQHRKAHVARFLRPRTMDLAFRARGGRTALEAAEKMGDADASLQDQRPPVWGAVLADREEWQWLMQGLSPTDRRIMEMHFVEGIRTVDVSRALGVSHSRISQLVARSCRRIRERIANHPRYQV